MKKHRVFLGLGLFLVMAAVALLPFNTSTAAEQPKYGGILKISRSASLAGIGFPQRTKIGEGYE